jgi:hypothetical protein
MPEENTATVDISGLEQSVQKACDTIDELRAQKEALVEALKRIRDGASAECSCEHDSRDCCEKQHPIDVFCPFCIADVALKLSDPRGESDAR